MSEDFIDLLEQGATPQDILALAQKLTDEGQLEKGEEGLALAVLFAQEKEDSDNEKRYLEELYRRHPTAHYKEQLLEFYSRLWDVEREKIAALVEKYKPGGVIGTLHQLYPFSPGHFLRHDLYGTGVVKRFDLEKNAVLITFKDTERGLFLFQERKYLTPLPRTHFYVQQFLHPEKIAARAKADPGLFMRELLSEFKELKESEIEKMLKESLGRKYVIFWKKARQAMLTDPRVMVEKVGNELLFSPQAGKQGNDSVKEIFRHSSLSEQIDLLKSLESSSEEFASLLEEVRDSIAGFVEEERLKWLYRLLETYLLSQDQWIAELKAIPNQTIAKSITSLPEKGRRKVLSSLLSILPLPTFLNSFATLYESILSLLGTLSSKQQQEILKYYLLEMPEYPRAFFTCLRCYGEKAQTFHSVDLLITGLKLIEEDPRCLADIDFLPWQENVLQQLSLKDATFVNRILSLYFEESGQKAIDRKVKLHYLFPELLPIEERIIYSSYVSIQRKEAELGAIRREKITENVQEIARARAFGDLSENHEYKAAKEKQSFLQAQLQQLVAELRVAQDITAVFRTDKIVTVGKRIRLKNSGNEKRIAFGGAWDVDESKGIFSYKSPLAEKVFGKRIGDQVNLEGKLFSLTEIEDF